MTSDLQKRVESPVASVSFRIFGDTLDFGSISRALDLTPTKALHKTNYDVWLLDSALPKTEPLDAHLGWLRRVLSPHVEFLQSLKAHAELRNYSGINPKGRFCDFSVSPGEMAFLQDLGMSLEMTILFIGSASETEGEGSAIPWGKALIPRALLAAIDEGSEGSQAPPLDFQPPGPTSKAAFTLAGHGLDFGMIAKVLSAEPTTAHKAGTVDGAGNYHEIDLWQIESALQGTCDVGSHLIWMARKLLPYSQAIGSLMRHASAEVRCYLEAQSDQCGFEVPPESFELMVRVGMPLRVKAHI